MKLQITKFVHSCLLVETPERVALFDPGVFSTVPLERLTRLDDILITHEHADHMDIAQIEKLQAAFPKVAITAPAAVVAQLSAGGVNGANSQPRTGVRFFEAPHEGIRPLAEVDPPEEVGIHYLDMLSHPGDSHHFAETMPVLALPVSAPWGSTVNAVAAVLRLTKKPKYIVPIHDWHWHSEARTQMYDRFEERFAEIGIVALKPQDGVVMTLDL